MARPRKDETTTSEAQAEGASEQAQDGAGNGAGNGAPMGIPSTLSKKELVLKALKALGTTAKPAKIHKWILKYHYVNMNPNHISSYKSQLRDASKKRKSSEAAPTPRANSSDDVSIKDIQTVKDLAERLGQKKFWSLIDLLVPASKQPRQAGGAEG